MTNLSEYGAGSTGARHQIVPDAQDAGQRLDRFIADRLPELSRSRAKQLIETGQVSCDGATIANPSARVKFGQNFAIIVPDARPDRPEPQVIPLSVVFEDEHLIVIDKPPGMVVHPAPGSPDATVVNALLAHCGDTLAGIGGVRRPGIVHRIDKDTSGLMVAAKTGSAHAALSRAFADHTIERAYLAMVWGVPNPSSGEIEGNIGRSPTNRKKMAVVQRGGKKALTRYRLQRTFGMVAALVECRLATGRTHQIRVHMAEKGHALIGDQTYGGRQSGRLRSVRAELQEPLRTFPRQALHAYLLGFSHPATGVPLRFESPLPADLVGLIKNLEEF